MVYKTIIENLMKKAGYTPEQISEAIADPDKDLDDNIANQRNSSLFTADEAKGSDAIFKDVKDKARSEAKAEALNAVDAVLNDSEEFLTPAQKVEYDKLGNNTFEKVKFTKGALKEMLKKGTGDLNFDELKRSFDALNGEIATKYVKKEDYDSITSELDNTRKENVNSRILTLASNVVLDPKKKADRHFQRNFLTDAEELLSNGIGDKKIKGKIDYKTKQIMREDSPDQPVMIGTKVLTIDDFVPLVAEFGEYNKGYTPPPADPIITIEEGGEKPGSPTIAQRRNLESINADAK